MRALVVACVASWAVAAEACTTSPPSAVASPSSSDAIPSGSSGWAQVQAELSARRATAQAEIGEANRALRASASDCADSCTGVVTLRGAVERLCRIRESHDDDVRCKEARTNLTATAGTVMAACDACRPPKPDDDDGGAE